MKKIMIDKNHTLERIDKFVAKIDESLSRSHIRKMIDNEYVLVNEEPTKSNYNIKIGDVIEIDEMPLEDVSIVAEDIFLDIVYEDECMLVINKPSGMVVHPGAGVHSGTLVNSLLYHIKDLSGINGKIRPGIVHRIDKDTSGLLVVAKNDQAHKVLADQLVDKTLYRVYTALVHGQVNDQKIVVDAPIGRDKNDRTKMCITADNSKKALTKIECLEIYEKHSLIECQLETGRTHQIRVHLQYIKHPIVGDYKYGRRKDDFSFGQYLHARKIGFKHPLTNEYMQFEVDLPEEFKNKIEELKK